MKNEKILLLDFGGLNNQTFARLIRDCSIYCEVHPYTMSIEDIKKFNPKGIVLLDEEKELVNNELFNLGCPVFSANNENKEQLKEFAIKECNCKCDWTVKDFVNNTIEEIKGKVGNGKVLLALSGGVDSSVCAVLLSKAIGKQLTCVFVDHGLMRKNEADEVESVFGPQGKYDLNFIRVNAQQRFYGKLAGVTDPEQKRKIIGAEFIRVFEEEAKKIGAVDFLAQGTIYPDIIESGIGKQKVIKSHHNVGGLPSVVDFKEIVEPLKLLFKDEVRKAGLELGLPEYLVFRQPFPGPGLGVRIIGEITEEKVKIVQEADFIYREEIQKAGLDNNSVNILQL